MVHEGTSDPKVISADYVNFLTVSSRNIADIINELKELVSFVIRSYIRRTAPR